MLSTLISEEEGVFLVIIHPVRYKICLSMVKHFFYTWEQAIVTEGIQRFLPMWIDLVRESDAYVLEMM